jgi:hypothetical protein
LALAGWGIATAPFDWDIDFLPRDPVPVDAIPDIGDNQQIVFTEWPGRSPQDIEDQITYPLTTQLLGLPGVRTVRSNSMFGFSTINVIFEDDIEFYWSRSRILEKLNSLPGGTLPEGVQPALGPDATGLGQIFWYTLEGYDSDGNPTGGWDPARTSFDPGLPGSPGTLRSERCGRSGQYRRLRKGVPGRYRSGFDARIGRKCKRRSPMLYERAIWMWAPEPSR